MRLENGWIWDQTLRAVIWNLVISRLLIYSVTRKIVLHLTTPGSSFLEVFSSVMDSVHEGGRKSVGLGVVGILGSRRGGLWRGPVCCPADPHLVYSDITKTAVPMSFFLKFFCCCCWKLHLQPSLLFLVLKHSMCTTHLCKSVLLGKFGLFDLHTACLLIWISFTDWWWAVLECGWWHSQD